MSDVPGDVRVRELTMRSLSPCCPSVCADPMPVDQEQYYGFTQFAVELNELDSALKPLLPPTDTRFRPDQRSAHHTPLLPNSHTPLSFKGI